MADKKTTVLFDRVSWYTGTGNDRQRHFADKGDTITLPAGEFERLSGLGAIGSETELAKQEAATAGGTEAPSLSDAELEAMSIDALKSYFAQHPGELDRIDALEDQRTERRKGVDEFLDAARATT